MAIQREIFLTDRVALKSLGTLSQGLLLTRYRKEKTTPGSDDYRVVQLRDLDRLTIQSTELELERLVLPQTDGLFLLEGDVLITVKGAVQRASVVDAATAGAIAVQNMAVFRVTPGLAVNVLPLYVAGLLRSEAFSPELSRLYRQSTGTRSISLKQLANLTIPLPSWERQQAFAAAFVALERFALASERTVNARQTMVEQSLHALLGEGQ